MMDTIAAPIQHVTFSCVIRKIICILVISSLGHSIQFNDVALSNQQKLISNNTTRLKENSDLSPIEFGTSDNDAIKKIEKSKRPLNRKQNLFSSWSSWSDCDKKCNQKRSRYCVYRRKCGKIHQQEERSCPEYICDNRRNQLKNVYDSEEENVKSSKKIQRRKNKIGFEEDPYIADDEDDDYLEKKRQNDTDRNKLVMKVVKQGDYRHKQSMSKGTHELGNIEQEFFLPRNLSAYSRKTFPKRSSLKIIRKRHQKRDSDDNESLELEMKNYDEETSNEWSKSSKTKAVFEMPRKPVPNYTKWSKWSKCTSKCITRRYKKCRPHARAICGNDVIREVAYCYTEGSFCEEWISTQMSKIGSYNDIEVPKVTTKAPRVSRRTESPLINSVSQNFYGSDSNLPTNSKKRNKIPPEFKPQNFQCGFPEIRNKNSDIALKIIGGKTARQGQWPWQVAILNRYKEAFCGGTLISPNWVLTASHCVRKRLYVVLGEHNLNVRSGHEIEFKIQTTIKHPLYNKRTVDSDIALLKLPRSVERSKYVRFACLPEKLQPLPTGKCTVIGWGKRRHNDDSGTNILHEAEVPIISNDVCKNVYYDYVITKNMFCAGASRVDTCAGDSGGALLCRDTKKSNKPWTVFGITSFGDGCGKKNKFGIYTKLTNYVDFIWSIINCNGLCDNSTL